MIVFSLLVFVIPQSPGALGPPRSCATWALQGRLKAESELQLQVVQEHHLQPRADCHPDRIIFVTAIRPRSNTALADKDRISGAQ